MNKSLLLLALVLMAAVGCGSPRVGVGHVSNSPSGPSAGVIVEWGDTDSQQPAHGEVAEENNFPVPADTSEEDVGAAATTLRKSERAPYSGTLLSPRAMGRVIAELESLDDRVNAEVEYHVGKTKAEADLQIRLREIELNAERQRRTIQVNTRDAQIRELNEQLAESGSNDTAIWWGVGGTALGTALTIIVVLLVGGGS